MSILDTWGWIFTHGLSFFEQESSVSTFDVSQWRQNLFHAMNVRFFTSLYTHLDVIALEIFGSDTNEAPEAMERKFARFLEVARPLVQLVPLSSSLTRSKVYPPL